MSTRILPKIKMKDRPDGLKFNVPEAARAKYSKAISDQVIETARAAAKKDESPREIAILGDIGASFWDDSGTTAALIKKKLDAFGKGDVKIIINSPGGDAFEGIAIYNLLRAHDGKIKVEVLGLAASAASVIAMAGDDISVGTAAFLMIHSAWGVVMGNRNDMRDFADVLDQLDTAIADLYSSRSGQSRADVLGMMEKETWMTGVEAVKLGFADEAIEEPKEKKAAKNHRTVSIFAQSTLPAAALGIALAATSKQPPGASGIQLNANQGTADMTNAEALAAYEKKRAANVARMEAIMNKSVEEGVSLDADQTTEYDALAAEVETIDAQLVRMRKHIETIKAKAAVVEGDDIAAGTAARIPGATKTPNSGIVALRSNVAQGIPFTRYVKAMCLSGGNPFYALEIAKHNEQWKSETPEVAQVLLAAVAAGDTTTAGWASEWAYKTNLTDQFIELLRPATVIGRLTGLVPVPFNVRMGSQTSGSTSYWVGQGLPTPVSKLVSGEVTLGIAKAAGLVVLTKELIRNSSPSAEMLVRNDLIKCMAEFQDRQFLDPSVAEVANVNPASITNGLTALTPTGTTAATLRADLETLMDTFIADNLDPTMGTWIMDATMAMRISMMQNSLGQAIYPTLGMNGGTLLGMPVIVSNSANISGSPGSGHMIILINQAEVMLADEGQTTIDASNEASIQMLDNPTNASAGSTVATTMVSMFQTHSVALLATRFMNWKKRRSTAVAYIKEAAYLA